MITIVLTYRNRSIAIVENALDSLSRQHTQDFQVILVDYGSQLEYKKNIQSLVKQYAFVNLIRCNTAQQLWCKSRAINIALKKCTTDFFFVGDIDMIYHPDFVSCLHSIKQNNKAIYFQVGFLSQQESQLHTNFDQYQVAFLSQESATGMTLYPTQLLKSINGYDEYFNGWGSEDTDTHVRLKNAQYPVDFYTDRLLMLHQWHPKAYRTLNQQAPFHTQLESINASYLDLVQASNKIKANTNMPWGEYQEEDYNSLNNISKYYSITNTTAQVHACINSILLQEKGVVQITVHKHKEYRSLKDLVKQVVRKKRVSFLSFEEVNNLILSSIVNHLRNKAYQYRYDTINQKITLVINL